MCPPMRWDPLSQWYLPLWPLSRSDHPGMWYGSNEDSSVETLESPRWTVYQCVDPLGQLLVLLTKPSVRGDVVVGRESKKSGSFHRTSPRLDTGDAQSYQRCGLSIGSVRRSSWNQCTGWRVRNPSYDYQ